MFSDKNQQNMFIKFKIHELLFSVEININNFINNKKNKIRMHGVEELTGRGGKLKELVC